MMRQLARQCLDVAVGPYATVWPWPGLGAILRGRRRMRVDGGGLGSPQFQAGWTLVDAHGPRLELYGSEGWGSSPSGRARQNPW